MAPDNKQFDHLFIVMELFESDLHKLIKNDPPIELSESQVKVMIYNSLCALNFMHSANVLHRDIKPANILIQKDCNVRVCDFSISRCMPRKSEDDRLFQHQLKSIRK